MAISNKPLFKGFNGLMENTYVVKQYPGDPTMISIYPGMSKVNFSLPYFQQILKPYGYFNLKSH